MNFAGTTSITTSLKDCKKTYCNKTTGSCLSAKIIFILLSGVFGACLQGRTQDTLDLFPLRPGSLTCWTETRTSPRPLKLRFIKADMTCRDIRPIVLTGEDPDGKGPAESSLTPPEDLFKRYGALAAVNANAFEGLPGTGLDIRGWYKDRPVDMHGLVVSDGKVISPPETGRTAFWVDKKGRPHLGDPPAGVPALAGVADWSGQLLVNGRMMADSTVGTLHPRTALGFDDTGRWLLILVADGRQSGFSEGMSLYEMAVLFRSKGCTQAINLDGGGSSIMMVRDSHGRIITANNPSGGSHRPVPVMLGFK
jgi:hypothetical protein